MFRPPIITSPGVRRVVLHCVARRFAVLIGVMTVLAGVVGTQPLGIAQEKSGAGNDQREQQRDEAWTEFVNLLRSYEEAPSVEAARAVLDSGERWLRRPGRVQRRLDTLRVLLEVCRRHGEDERIVSLTTRFLREMGGELQIWLLEHKASALVRLGRDDEVAGLITQLRSMRESRRQRTAAQRAIWRIERQQRLRPGEAPPPFELPELDGDEPVALENLVNGPTLLVFWESWHPDARMLLSEELSRWPALREAQEKAPAGLPEIVLISRESAETQAAFREAHEYPWRFLVDAEGQAFEAYRIRGLPYLVELDAEGQVVRTGFELAEFIRVTFEASLAEQPQAEGAHEEVENTDDNEETEASEANNQLAPEE